MDFAMLGCGSNTINNESNSMSFVFQKSWLEEVPGVDFWLILEAGGFAWRGSGDPGACCGRIGISMDFEGVPGFE